MRHILRTLLELGDATSHNLEFSYQNEAIGFGEETITEMNLLEIRRRHPDQVYIRTFTKAVEGSVTGADWEWHVVGRRYTLKMRVQAKRVTKHGSIRDINKKTASIPQIDLLIKDAARFGMRPVYCLYCCERHRKIWKKSQITDAIGFEPGCLLADAETVRKVMPKRLSEIEKYTIPWHYIWSRRSFEFSSSPFIVRFADTEEYRTVDIVSSSRFDEDASHRLPRFPTVAELNGQVFGDADQLGLFETADADQSKGLEADALDRGISRIVVVDVRAPDLMLRQFEQPTGGAG